MKSCLRIRSELHQQEPSVVRRSRTQISCLSIAIGINPPKTPSRNGRGAYLAGGLLPGYP